MSAVNILREMKLNFNCKYANRWISLIANTDCLSLYKHISRISYNIIEPAPLLCGAIFEIIIKNHKQRMSRTFYFSCFKLFIYIQPLYYVISKITSRWANLHVFRICIVYTMQCTSESKYGVALIALIIVIFDNIR